MPASRSKPPPSPRSPKPPAPACSTVEPTGPARVDYPDFANTGLPGDHPQGKARAGVLICGTGNGMAMAANRHPDIRCGYAFDVTSARLTRAHNNANVIAIGARLVGEEVAVGYHSVPSSPPPTRAAATTSDWPNCLKEFPRERAIGLRQPAAIILGVTVISDVTVREVRAIEASMPRSGELWLGGVGNGDLGIKDLPGTALLLNDLPALERECLRWRH